MRPVNSSLPGGGASDIDMFSTSAYRFSNFASNFVPRVSMAVQTSVPSQLSDSAPDHKKHMYVKLFRDLQ